MGRWEQMTNAGKKKSRGKIWSWMDSDSRSNIRATVGKDFRHLAWFMGIGWHYKCFKFLHQGCWASKTKFSKLDLVIFLLLLDPNWKFWMNMAVNHQSFRNTFAREVDHGDKSGVKAIKWWALFQPKIQWHGIWERIIGFMPSFSGTVPNSVQIYDRHGTYIFKS